MKETTELNTFVGDVVAGVAASLADGKLNVADVVNFLPALGSGQEGLRGIREFGPEAHTATVAQNEAVKAALSSRLSSLPPTDRYYLTEGLHGIQCLLRFVAKESYERGLQQGLAASTK